MILKTYRIHILVPLALITASTCPAASDDEPIHFRVYSGKAYASVGAQIDKQFAAAESEVRSGVFDQAAETLFAAAQRYTKGVFPLPSLDLIRAVTRRDTGDTIVAEWRVTEPFANGSLVMEDTPVVSKYTFRLTNCAINNRDELSDFLRKLIAWGSKAPLGISSVVIDLPSDSVNQSLNQFSGSTMRAPMPVVYDFVIQGARRGDEWLILVQIGKGMTGDFYPRPHFVAERFPPLADLAKSWTPDRIKAEIGRAVDLMPLTMDFNLPRDEALIAELCRRGLSEGDFRAILGVHGDSVDGLGARAQLVTDALQRAGEQARLLQYAKTGFDLYEQIGPKAANAVSVLFGAISIHCDPEFEARAVTFLRKGVFYQGSLLYLGKCSSSREALSAVESVTVPSSFTDVKEIISQGIRKRLNEVRARP